MKYGTAKYNTCKYGLYQISHNIRLDTFRPVSKVRIRSGKEIIIAQTIVGPLAKKYRVNGTIAYTLSFSGCYNKIRVRTADSSEFVITRTVK